jgi:hypothetical protein
MPEHCLDPGLLRRPLDPADFEHLGAPTAISMMGLMITHALTIPPRGISRRCATHAGGRMQAKTPVAAGRALEIAPARVSGSSAPAVAGDVRYPSLP